MAAVELLRDLPRTEDSRRLVLEWLDRIESERTVERTGETNKDVFGEELAENGLTASRGGSASDKNGSTAPRGGSASNKNGSTAPQGRPPSGKEGSTAICGRPPKSQDKGIHMGLFTPFQGGSGS